MANGKSPSRPGSSARSIWGNHRQISRTLTIPCGFLPAIGLDPFPVSSVSTHQSSHLGDEFILNSKTPINRINLSFEELDLKVAYEPASWLRIYGGGSMLVDRDTKELKRGTSEAPSVSHNSSLNAKISSDWRQQGLRRKRGHQGRPRRATGSGCGISTTRIVRRRASSFSSTWLGVPGSDERCGRIEAASTF